MNVSRQSDATFMESVRIDAQKMEIAGRNVDKFLAKDSAAPTLLNLMNVSPQTGSTSSGCTDHDYPILSGIPLNLNNMTQMKQLKHVPLPPEIMEHFGHVQCHCMMGLFPEMNRAWLTVDSDIYVWTYQENSDLAYFDGLNETILCVGLVKPKARVFHNFIKYLLVLCTSVDIVVLGVTFGENLNDTMAEIQLIPDPVFTIPTDGATITTVVGSSLGRIFLGSKEGNLYEIDYQAESGWFGKRCRKINHSTSALSFLVPAFLNAALNNEDGILQISIDNTRHILYILTEKGSIEICDLGEKGNSYSRITKINQSNIVQQAMYVVKTLDSQNFRPVVSISAVESLESAFTNLVAITQSGIRLYFSTSSISNPQPNQRPYALCLQHVRLPPGYSANITVRPRMVHAGLYRDRNCILVSTVNEIDVLWCISGDMFPFSHTLMEAYTTINLGASAIAIAEVRQSPLTSELYDRSQELVPLLIRQHYEPPRKFVVLTSQGVHILQKNRPVDLLRQLLLDGRGADCEPVKSFFIIETEDQACATSLILASLESQTNVDLAEAATRAFFIYGGEPKLNINTAAPSTSFNQKNYRSSIFQPNVVSTPGPQHLKNPMHMSTTLNETQASFLDPSTIFQFSSKHNGLYLYLGRILRPVWERKCVQLFLLDDKLGAYTSTVSAEHIGMILNNLMALHNFLLLNTQLCVCGPTHNQNMSINTTVRPSYTLQEVQLEERQSLDSLKIMVCHCCQVFGLWKILCEHQLHDLLASLQENQRKMIENTTFKDLCLYGQDFCCLLITTLINSYLGDNASVDSIASRLREVCPHFYRAEDAAFSKAIEMLKASQGTQNNDEKEELIISALALCKSITPNMNLHEVCVQFTNLRAYKAVIDLCHETAKKIDPDKVAEHFYKHSNSADDEGFNYYTKRMEIYQEILDMLEVVYQNNISVNQKNTSQAQNVPDESQDLSRKIIQEILDTEDDMMQVALYTWMISKNMTNDLIKIANRSLEMFLTHHSQRNSDIQVMDLLWKYYESNNNHGAAAKILSNLATMESNKLNLNQRIAYLARALMCMSNSKTGYVPSLGIYYKDLEDKLDVAKVQELLLNTFQNMNPARNPAIAEAITALDSGLYQISQLYEDFAEPFELWECKLAIIDCADYQDLKLAETIWKNILKNELKSTIPVKNKDKRMLQILGKVKLLARKYANSVNCFPLEYIVHELEVISVSIKSTKSLVPQSLMEMNIPMEKLILVYNQLMTLTSGETFWKMEEHEFHFAESIAALITCFIEESERYANNNPGKRRIVTLCQDTVAEILSNLYSKPNTEQLINVLRGIQARLSRL